MRPALLISLVLCGCAAAPDGGRADIPERHYSGVIEKVEQTTRQRAARTALTSRTLYGGVGSAMYRSPAHDQASTMQVVKLESGSSVTVISDDEVRPGDCVRLIVKDLSAEPLPWYGYGQAALQRIRCDGETRESRGRPG